MAVTEETPIASSVANGVTTVFPHSFTVLDDGDLVVTGTVSNVTTTYTLGVDYTVSGVGTPSGSVTFVTPPASGTIVTRYRDIALTRETDYQDNGDLLADVLNADMDRLVFMLQDIFNGGKVVPTCLRAPNGETLNALPSALARAGYFLGFDGLGQPTLLSATAGTAAALSADLASASDAIKGDAIIGVKRTETGAVATTQHAVNQARPIYPGPDFGATVDGVTSDTTPLANMTAAGMPFVIPAKAAYQYGSIGPAHGIVNRVDVATIGSSEKLTNGGFTGSATGWTLTNFTYSSNTITHTAGTAGTAVQSITVSSFRMHQISVTLTTTTRGGVDFQFNGSTMLDDSGYYVMDTGTVTLTFPWLSPAGATANFTIATDTAWAGSVDSVSLIEVSDELPLSWVTVPTDDASLRIPYGLKFGRYNAGVIALGDRQTMSLAGSSATWNIAIGPRSLQGNISGIENTAVGAFAGRYTTSSRNTFYGYSAGKYNTTGEQLTALGYKALTANTVGVRNTGVGYHSGMQSTAGNDNTLGGWQAGYNILTTSGNTVWGSQAGMNGRGTQNTYVGALAGYLNANVNITYSYSFGTMVGSQAVVYGESGTAIGFNAVVGADGAPKDNAMAIGANATTKLANSAKIGNALNAITLSGRMHNKQPLSTVTSGTGVTYSASEFTDSRVISRSGPAGGFTDNTPTAAAIVAAIPGCEVGTGYDLYIRNSAGGTLTLGAGAGVTLSGTTTVVAGNTRHYIVQVTNVGSGTEAVTVVGMFTAAS